MVVLGVLIVEWGSDQWNYGFLARACVGSKFVYIIVDYIVVSIVPHDYN